MSCPRCTGHRKDDSVSEPAGQRSINLGSVPAGRRGDDLANEPADHPIADFVSELTPGFLIYDFLTDRKSSILGVWAAPGPPGSL